MTESFIATSVARRMMSRMQATHERRRISVFAGPPGIGKTTAIDAFRSRHPAEVVIVKVARRNARASLVLQHVLEALRPLTDTPFVHVPTSLWELRNALFGTICQWLGLDARAAKDGQYDLAAFPRLTLVFDEAQNLSAEAIEALRYWNDADRCYAPFPLGLVFVGNSEFSLSGGSDSVISAAVADRALYLQTFDYADVTDDDLSLFIDVCVDIEGAAIAAILRTFKAPRSIRSFRRLADLLDQLQQMTGARHITAPDIAAWLQEV